MLREFLIPIPFVDSKIQTNGRGYLIDRNSSRPPTIIISYSHGDRDRILCMAVGKLPITNIYSRMLMIDICVSHELQSFKMEMSGRFTVKETADGGNYLFRSFALSLKLTKINTLR
jgi:hypothetical protein